MDAAHTNFQRRKGTETDLKRPLAESTVLGLLLYATNLRGLELSRLFPPVQTSLLEAAMEVLLLGGGLWLLSKQSQFGAYARLWWRIWPMLVFLFFATASIAWTIAPAITAIRITILVCCTALAAYLAVRYPLQDLLDITARGFVVLVVVSAVLTLAWPAAGIMNVYPYYGSWRGLFWHRNYLGSTMAFAAMVLLLARVPSGKQHRKWSLVYGAAYVLAIVLVVQSHSATGLILLLILHVFLGSAVLWIRWHAQLHLAHYWILGATSVALAGVAWFKLDFLLSFFSRDSTLTGRVGLWSYLYEHVILQRPMIGHGFGALWGLPEFQLAVKNALGWPHPVFIGDNGYIDLMLHVGAIGLALFLAVLAWAFVRCFKFVRARRTVISTAPILVLSYMLLTNISLSYFLETESFTWLVVFAFVFSTVANEP